MLTKELRERFAQAMKEIDWDNPEERRASAAVIVSYLSDVIQQKNLADIILGKENLKIGETYEWTYRNRLKVYFHEPGSYAPRTQMTQKSFTIPMDMLSVHPEYEITQLKVGRYGTIEDQTNAAEQAFLGAINAYVFGLISGAVPAANIISGGAATVTKAKLDQAIRLIEDTGGVSGVIALKKHLDPVRDFNTSGTTPYNASGVYSPEVLEMIRTKGLLDIYGGAPIIPLLQWEDAFGKKTITEKEILIIGKDVGKFAIWEEVQNMEATDVDTLMWHVHMWTKIGAAVFFPDRIAKITLS